MSSNDRAYIRAFKESTKQDPNAEDLEKLEEEMYGASDRTSVIMLVAFLEAAFSSYIRHVLRGDITSDEKRVLFEFHGPLGTFSSQIAIAYGFGLIGRLSRDDLEIIRVVRNGAAHSRRSFSFDDQVVINVCAALKIPDSDYTYLDSKYVERMTGKKLQVGSVFDDKSSRTRFHKSVHTITANLITPREPKRVAMVIPFHLP